MKRTPADDAFSLCVRERAHWQCELCKTFYPEAQAVGRSRSLDCSHLFTRGNWSVRFSPINAFCHCVACHFRFGGDRELQRTHFEEVFGEGLYIILLERKQNSSIGRQAKREGKEIAKHYRQEFKRMRELRLNGATGRLEFTGYF